MSKKAWIGAFLIAGLWVGGKQIMSSEQASYGPYSEGNWQLSSWVTGGTCNGRRPFIKYDYGKEIYCNDSDDCSEGTDPNIARTPDGGYIVSSFVEYGITLPIKRVDSNTVVREPMSHLDVNKLVKKNGPLQYQGLFLAQFRQQVVYTKCNL